MASNDKSPCSAGVLPSQSHSGSLRSLLMKYFQRNTPPRTPTKPPPPLNRSPYVAQTVIKSHPIRTTTKISHHTIPTHTFSPISISSSSVPNHRLNHHATTATFTSQKRCLHEPSDENRCKQDLLNLHDEELLVRTRLSTRTSSLPGARCVAYYYHQQNPTLTAGRTTNSPFDESHAYQSHLSSVTDARSRSQSHSSSQSVANGGPPTSDISEHNSSIDEENRRYHRRNQPSRVSTPYNSSRYSQRAVAQFMHERNKARLRRNQKASRMLGRKTNATDRLISSVLKGKPVSSISTSVTVS